MADVNVLEYGAVPGGKVDSTAGLQSALDACAARGGGTVRVPAGVYLCGPFQLRSRVNLYLEMGAVLKASTRIEDYPQEAGSAESPRAGLVTARACDDVAITGLGAIDGSGLAFMKLNEVHTARDFDRQFTRQGADYCKPGDAYPHGPLAKADRPGNLVRLFGCRHVMLENVTIRNSPTWTVHVSECRDVDIRGVFIHSHASDCRVPNDDGIDVTRSSNVRIIGCNIQTGDDCIAVFSGEGIVVTGCTLTARSSGIRVGYRTGVVRRCVFSDCVIHEAHRGINLNVRGDVTIEDVLFSNMVIHTRLYTGHWWGHGEPIAISALPLQAEDTALGHVRGVTFRNIRASGDTGIVLWGDAAGGLEDVLIDGLTLRVTNGPLQAGYGGNYDLRGSLRLEEGIFRHDVPGVFARHVRGLTLRDVQVSFDEGVPAFMTAALQCDDCAEVTIDGFRGAAADGGAAVRLRGGRDVVVRRSVATRGELVQAESVERTRVVEDQTKPA